MDEKNFKEKIKSLIKDNVPGIPDKHIDLHSDSTYYWGPENFYQAAEWLSRTTDILHEPDRVSNSELFINFFGIIDNSELSAFLKDKAVGSFAALGYKEDDMITVIDQIEDLETKLYFQLIWKAKELFDTVHKQFTDDEKFLLRFLRHRHSHVTLSNFAVRIEGMGDDTKFKTANWEQLIRLSKTTTVESFRELLLQKLKPHKDTLKEIGRLLTPTDGERLFRE